MQITQWNPFPEMEDLFSHFGRGLSRAPAPSTRGDVVWAPAVDITETDKEYTVKAELPGVPKDAVKVGVENGVLTLSGERKYEKEDKDEKSHRVERFYGTFTRSFTVPEDVMTDRIEAEFKDGMLRIHLPKTDIRKSKLTQVKVQ